jgi:hypothetical protein
LPDRASGRPGGADAADATANTALFLGLFEYLMRSEEDLEARLPFAVARDNFYAAARDGLAAKVRWLEGGAMPLDVLLRVRAARCRTAGSDFGRCRCG